MSYEELERKYLGYTLSSVRGGRDEASDTGFFGSDTRNGYSDRDYKGKEEAESSPPPAPRMRPASALRRGGGGEAKSTKRVSLLLEEDDEEPRRAKTKDPDFDPDAEGMFKGMDVAMPIRRGQGGIKIPLRVQQAANEILVHAKNRDVTLSKETRQELENLTHHTDEFTVVDPIVTITATAETGTCKVHVKEVVNVSQYLLARALGASFFIQVTPKAKTQPASFDEVQVKPYRHSQSADVNQPFHLEKIIDAKLAEMEDVDPTEFLRQVQAYMFSLGPTSTLEASSAEYIEIHVDAFKQILRGDLVPIKEKQTLKEKLAALEGGGGGRKRNKIEEDEEELL